MIGRSLMPAIASMTSRLNSFGTVLTPMMPVGLNRLHRFDEGRDRRTVLRERLLEVGKVGARGNQQAVDVEQRSCGAAPRVHVHALHGHRLADQIGDARSGRSRRRGTGTSARSVSAS